MSKRKRNPLLGIDMNTVILVAGAIILLPRLSGLFARGAADAAGWAAASIPQALARWANEQVGATPVGGTLPSGKRLSWAVDVLEWQSFMGLIRAGTEAKFRVRIVHTGPETIATVVVELYDTAGNVVIQNAAQFDFPAAYRNIGKYDVIVTGVWPGVGNYSIGVVIIDMGSGGIQMLQPTLQMLQVMP